MWLGGLKSATTRADSREEKRQKLEAERLLRAQRAQQRVERQKQLEAATKARAEADKALQEFIQELLDIDPELFADNDFDASSVTEDFLEEESEIKMAENFEDLNTDNGADAIKSLGQIKVNWDSENPQYFFQKLETELQIFSINKQFTKRQALIRCLPDDIAKEFMHIVTLQETEAGNQPYKDLKKALIKAYGPRPGDAFQRALNRVMVGKPSVLLKLLISDICRHGLNGCCCSTTVWGLFQLKIPMYLKTGLANEDFNSTNMHSIMDRADNLWAANQTENQVSIVSVVKKEEEKTVVQAAAEVSAVGRGRGNANRRSRGRGGRNGRGGGRGGNQNQPDPRGQRHSSNPPWNSCTAHWLHAEGAWKCQAPTTCPMKDKTTPKN